jgi:ubiquinone/menaquinone biosynthesis C-methylase UbiE
MDSYKILSKYYIDIGLKRNLFIKQAELINLLLKNQQFGDKILDAACGTCKVFELLNTINFKFFGTDKSQNMINNFYECRK